MSADELGDSALPKALRQLDTKSYAGIVAADQADDGRFTV